MFPRNSEGIPRKHDSINTDAFDLKLLHSHCYHKIDCPYTNHLTPLEVLYAYTNKHRYVFDITVQKNWGVVDIPEQNSKL